MQNINYIDITLPLSSDLPHWPGAPRFWCESRKNLCENEEVIDSNIFMNVHTGTHVDAPAHFVRTGHTVDELSLDVLIGPAYVATVDPGVRVIDAKVLGDMNLPPALDRLLLKTDNSNLWELGWFSEDFTALVPSGAEWLVERGVKLVGIDYLSIQRFNDSPETHKILLQAGIVVVEGLNLQNIEERWYELICMPMKLRGLEGAPIRAILGDRK